MMIARPVYLASTSFAKACFSLAPLGPYNLSLGHSHVHGILSREVLRQKAGGAKPPEVTVDNRDSIVVRMNLAATISCINFCRNVVESELNKFKYSCELFAEFDNLAGRVPH